ncbi:low temperature requirement protein A [Micromonospora sp. NPDC050276]|uniref:low temperature requirement protein A n=1 Tax=Micromonospora sp. NPDC050276 TaxID=3364278 RepID=UPI00378AA751
MWRSCSCSVSWPPTCCTTSAWSARCTFLLVFTIAVLIGLLYVTPAGQRLNPAIERADPARLGVITGYLHLVMIAGLVVTAVGAELSIAHPLRTGDTAAVVVILSGPTLSPRANPLTAGISSDHPSTGWPDSDHRFISCSAIRGARGAAHTRQRDSTAEFEQTRTGGLLP